MNKNFTEKVRHVPMNYECAFVAFSIKDYLLTYVATSKSRPKSLYLCYFTWSLNKTQPSELV